MFKGEQINNGEVSQNDNIGYDVEFVGNDNKMVVPSKVRGRPKLAQWR